MGEYPLLEAALENVEAMVDAGIDNEIAKSIPIVSTVFKVLKAVPDIRNRIFAAKLTRVIQVFERISPETTEKIRQKAATSPDEAQKVGENLLLVLDKITALEKAEIIAYVFIAYTLGRIGAADFRRLADAIDQAFIDDLKGLLNAQKSGRSQASYMKHLERAGLTFADLNKIPRNRQYHHYVVSDLGTQLIAAYSAGMEYCYTSKEKARRG